MDNTQIPFKNIDEYVAQLPVAIRETFEELRQVIKTTVPEAVEVISYQMPAFKYHGMLAYIAVFKNHYSLFPGVKAVEEFAPRLSKYKVSKGGIQFPMNEHFPKDVVIDIVKFCARNNYDKAQLKKVKKPKMKNG